MSDPAGSMSVTEAIRLDGERRRQAQAEAFVGNLAAPEPTQGPDDGLRSAPPKPARPQTRSVIDTGEMVYGIQPDGEPDPELQRPARSAPPPAAATPKPAARQTRSVADTGELVHGVDDMAGYVYDVVDWYGANDFFDLPLSKAANLLELPDVVQPQDAEAWGSMPPASRAQVVDYLAENPGASLSEAMHGARQSQGEDSIGGGSANDTLPAETHSMIGAVAGDIGAGVMESPVQILGGAMDGLFEMGALLNRLKGPEYIVAVDPDTGQVTSHLGRSTDQIEADARKAYQDRVQIHEPRSTTGGLVRGVGQFLAGFGVGGKVLKSVGWMAGTAKASRAMAQAALADFGAFDGHEARLSDMVEQFPALHNPVTEYLASDMDDSELQGRLKNVAEGALSDVALSGLVVALHSVRLARKTKAKTGVTTYREAARRAARDSTKGSDILPDASALKVPNAPMLADARQAVQLSDLGQKRSPRAQAREIRAFLNKVKDAQADGVSPDLKRALADLRANGTPKPARGRPAARILEAQGGIDPTGPVGQELAARGITPKTHRTLFRDGGRQNLDNLVLSEHDIFNGRELDDGTGYVPEQAWIDALDDEYHGSPWQDITAPIDGEKAQRAELAQYLDDLDLDPARDSDTEIAARLEDAARERNDRAAIDAMDASQPRSEADLEVELAAMEKAGNPHVSSVDLGGDKVYVNWGRIETEHDVRALIQKLADSAQTEIDDARRGIRSNEDTALAAEQENAWQLLLERRKGQAMNAEQSLAIRRLWAASGERVASAAREMAKTPTPQNAFVFRRAMALHGTIQREVIAARTETARALQQWAIPAGTDEFVARQMQDLVTLYGDVDVSQSLAQKLASLADEGNLAAIDEVSRNGALAATSEAVTTYWVQGLLTGPKTQMVNAGSNSAVVFLQQAERAVAAQIGALRGTVDPVEVGEAAAMFHGMVSSLPDAVRLMAKAYKTGESGFGIGKVELPRRRPISTEALGNTTSDSFNAVMNAPIISHGINAFGAIIDGISTRPLMAADEFFKTINYRSELHAQAFRQSAQEVRAGGVKAQDQQARMVDLLMDPSEAMQNQARDFAQYATFTNDAGDMARIVNKLRNRVPMTRYVFPFVNTVANILRFATERSPAAPLLGDVRADIRAGGARADMAVAKMGVGSMMMALAYDHALQGRITGSGPTNLAERQALMRMGWRPNSIRFGDRFFSFSRLDPMGAQLAVAANMAEMTLNSDLDPGEDYDEAAYRSIGAVGQMMMDKAYLKGASDLFSAMDEPQRYAPAYFENLLGSFVPAIIREAETFVDPELRAASNTLENIKMRIPGMSADLPKRHDLWGREISFQSGLGSLYDAVSPIYSARLDAEPVDQEFMKLGYFPGMPSRNVTIGGETFVLRNDPKVYERYVVLQGGTPASDLPVQKTTRGVLTATSQRMAMHGDKTMLEALNAIVTGNHPMSEEYAAAAAEDRIALLKKVIGDYRRVAKQSLIDEFPETFTAGTGRTRGGTASSFLGFTEISQ